MTRISRAIAALPLIAMLSCAAGAAVFADDAPRKSGDTHDIAAFREQVQPLLAKYCRKCHSGDEPQGELSLEGFLERGTLVADRKTWEKVAAKLHSHEMPPEEEPQPQPAEREQITAWIDGGLARNDCGRDRDPGRVTLRRLNRNEYNNTIRDLVGVDFHPADDFPSDDVGYGFDNIGDVLSMPPILLEKYLDAAQRIVERALGSNQYNVLTGDVTGGQVIDGGARMLSTKVEVRTKAKMQGEGEHILRIRAYGEQAGDEPVKMGVYVDNNTVRVFDVKAVAGHPETYEAWVRVKHGVHTFSVVFLNDYYDADASPPQDRNLVVTDLELMGPYPTTYRKIIPREHTPEDKMLLAREVIGGVATRAFRRPATATEVDRLLKLVELASAEGENFGGAIAAALEAVLVSPHFLFRVELDPALNEPQVVRTLNDYELATRLSYFLWSSLPDDELTTLARSGTLAKPENLKLQVRRMLADPKSQALIENFAGQWLQLRNLKTVAPDPATYPSFDDALRRAMQTETEMFFAAIMREDRSVLDFLDGDYTFVNDRLARHYGLPGVEGETFRRVALEGNERGGVLSQASVLTVTSNPTRTSPVKRGKWVLENILGTPPPPPPAAVPPLADNASAAAAASLRERMLVHRAKAECGVCHNRMDPLGFGLENYDGIGAWRDREGALAIDASGTLPGGHTFSGPGELKQTLRARQDDFVRCLAEKMLTYALGRGAEYSDKCTVTEIAKRMQQNDYKFSSLIDGIVTSEPFQKRRGRGSNP